MTATNTPCRVLMESQSIGVELGPYRYTIIVETHHYEGTTIWDYSARIVDHDEPDEWFGLETSHGSPNTAASFALVTLLRHDEDRRQP